MSLPSATVLGAVGLGAVGAVLAAGAALSAPNPSPRSDQQPVVVTTSTPLPCPAGTEERADSCVKVVVAPAEPAPAETHRAPAAVPDSTGSNEQESPEAEPSDVAETPDHEDGEHDSQDSQEHEDGQDHPDSGGETGD
jgi:hypothetical protein